MSLSLWHIGVYVIHLIKEKSCFQTALEEERENCIYYMIATTGTELRNNSDGNYETGTVTADFSYRC